MALIYRKTTPKVKRGKVQRKNRSALTPSYYNTPQDVPAVDRERPGRGYRHLLKKRDIIDFISILPDWERLSRGLNVILLARGEFDVGGWHDRGVVAVCAWEKALWRNVAPPFFESHAQLFKRLEVPYEKESGGYLCRFTEETARAYQLLHVLLHELGHHHDRVTTRSKRKASRGDAYAEQYAMRHADVIWHRYCELFQT